VTIKVYNILDSKKGPNTFIIDKNTKIKGFISIIIIIIITIKCFISIIISIIIIFIIIWKINWQHINFSAFLGVGERNERDKKVTDNKSAIVSWQILSRKEEKIMKNKTRWRKKNIFFTIRNYHSYRLKCKIAPTCH